MPILSTDFNTQMKEFARGIISHLQQEGLAFFVGGSTRFGYASTTSDVDIFAYMVGIDDPALRAARNLCEWVSDNGGRINHEDRYGQLDIPGKRFRFDFEMSLDAAGHPDPVLMTRKGIDLLVFGHYASFTKLAIDHHTVALYLSVFPEVAEYIKREEKSSSTYDNLVSMAQDFANLNLAGEVYEQFMNPNRGDYLGRGI